MTSNPDRYKIVKKKFDELMATGAEDDDAVIFTPSLLGRGRRRFSLHLAWLHNSNPFPKREGGQAKTETSIMSALIGFLLSLMIAVVAHKPLAWTVPSKRDKKGGFVVVTGKISEENSAGVKISSRPWQGSGPVQRDPSRRMTTPPIAITTAMNKFAADETNCNYPAVLKGYEANLAMPELKTTGVDSPVLRLSRRQPASPSPDRRADESRRQGPRRLLPPPPRLLGISARGPATGRLLADVGDYPGATKPTRQLAKSQRAGRVQTGSDRWLIDVAFQSEDYAAGESGSRP